MTDPLIEAAAAKINAEHRYMGDEAEAIVRLILPLIDQLRSEGNAVAPRPYPHVVEGMKCSEYFGFDGGSLTIKTTGPQENGAGWFCFGEHECDHEIDDETGKGYWIVNVANSELIFIRDKLNEIFPEASRLVREDVRPEREDQISANEASVRARRFGSCGRCGSAMGHDYALGGAFCLNPKCQDVRPETVDQVAPLVDQVTPPQADGRQAPKDELLPCPFCGAEMHLFGHGSIVRVWSGSAGAEAHAKNCPIRNRNLFDEVAYESETEAITAWNTRTRPDIGEPVAWRVDDLTSKGALCDSFALYSNYSAVERHVRNGGIRHTKVTPLYALPAPPATEGQP